LRIDEGFVAFRSANCFSNYSVELPFVLNFLMTF
jgi:hypothetical protein